MEDSNQTSQDQEVQSQTPSPVNNSSGSKLIPIILGIAAVAVIAIGAYLLGTKQSQPSQPIPTITHTPSPTNIPTSILLKDTFLKRQFDQNGNFFETTDYPNEIRDLNESDLIGMNCTSIYNGQYNQFSDYSNRALSKKTDKELEDKLIMLYDDVKRMTKEESFQAQYCDIADGRKLLMYQISRSGGGAGKDVYVTLVKDIKTLDQIVKIPSEPYAYFGCMLPLQLTKDGILYYLCGSEGSSSIYRVNLNKKQYNLLQLCMWDSYGTENSTHSCRNTL